MNTTTGSIPKKKNPPIARGCCLVLLTLTLILGIFPASGQKSSIPPPFNFVYRSWNNQSGLPQNTVFDMVQDSMGYLWGATEEGLFRFDGSEFSIINESNTPGILSSAFYDLLPSGKDLWASNRNAIIRIRNKVEKVIDLRKYATGGLIKCIEKDEDGRIWVGTSTGMLYYLQNDSVYSCPQWKAETSGAVEKIKYTPGGLLIGTATGLFCMKNPSAKPEAISRFTGISVNAITGGQPNEWWIGTSKGLFRLAADTIQFTEKEGLRENFINSLLYTKDGKLWIGLRSAGYQLYVNGQFIAPAQGVTAHDGIRSILAVNDQLVWLGTNSSGLVQLKPALIKDALPEIDLSGKIILAIYQHVNGEIWVGTAGKGVHRYHEGKLSQYNQQNGLSSNLVLSIYGRKDYIFIGTSNGMDRFNRKTGTFDKHYSEKDSLQKNTIISLFNDSKDRLWINTRSGGLHRMEADESIKPFGLPASLGLANFLCAFEDSRHNTWFGSRGAGMIRISEQDEVVHYYQKQEFPADIVYSFFEDKEGDIWMGTEKGLVVYSKGRFRLFGKASGLLFGEVYRILEDASGYVWLSGNLGLQRIATKELLRAKTAVAGNAKLPVKLFNAFDGMPNSETNGGFFPAGWAMQDGTIWFPTVQGVAVVDHRLISEEVNSLDIHVQSLRYGNNEYFPHEAITVPPGVYNFEIRYTSIDFSKASDIQFFYRLKGLDNDWTAAGNRHIAYFSALAPGNYTFEVKAERYGFSSAIAVLEFRVQPHFYQTTAFKVLLGLLAILLIAAVIGYLRWQARRKIRQQQRITRAQISGQEKERQFISTELHDSINQQLSTAKIYLDYARTHEDSRPELIGKSADVVRTVIYEIRALCNSLTPPTLKDIGLKEALEDLFGSYTTVGKFAAHWQFDLDPETLEEDLQFTLYRITQEQVNNIARHANASNVWLDFHASNTAIIVSIRDDGQGFDPRTTNFGLGYENIKNRLSLYQGKMELKTAPGKGCTLLLHIPLNGSKGLSSFLFFGV